MSRLRQLREKNARLTRAMQTFCLVQDRATYDEIRSSESLMRLDGFTAWRHACEYKYGWGDPSGFLELDARLSHRAVSEPSKSVATDLLHVFYATGELKYIDLFYQMMGHIALSVVTRRELVELYKEARQLYRDVNPGEMETRRLGLRPDVIDFTCMESAIDAAKNSQQ